MIKESTDYHIYRFSFADFHFLRFRCVDHDDWNNNRSVSVKESPILLSLKLDRIEPGFISFKDDTGITFHCSSSSEQLVNSAVLRISSDTNLMLGRQHAVIRIDGDQYLVPTPLRVLTCLILFAAFTGLWVLGSKEDIPLLRVWSIQ